MTPIWLLPPMGLPCSGLTRSISLLLLVFSSLASASNGESTPEKSLPQSLTYFFQQLEQPGIRQAIVSSTDRSLPWVWLGSRGHGNPIGLLLNGAADRAEWNEDDVCPHVALEHSFDIKPMYVAVPDLTTKTAFKTPCMLINYTHGSEDSLRPDVPVALDIPEQASLWPPIRAANKVSVLRLAENRMIKIKKILKGENVDGEIDVVSTEETTTVQSRPSGRHLGSQGVGVRELDVDADYDGGPRDLDKLTRKTGDGLEDDHDKQEVEDENSSEVVSTGDGGADGNTDKEENRPEHESSTQEEIKEEKETSQERVNLRVSGDNAETDEDDNEGSSTPQPASHHSKDHDDESIKVEKIEEEEEDNFMSGASAVAVFLLIMLLLMAFVLLALYKRRRRMRRMVNITMPLAEHEESGVYHVRMQEERRRERIGPIGSFESLPTTLGAVGNVSSQEIDNNDAETRRLRKEMEANAQAEVSQADVAIVDIENEEGRRFISGAGAVPPIIPSISNGNLI